MATGLGRDLEAIRGEKLFAMLVDLDTYEAASRVHDLLVKTHPADREKIELTRRLISEELDIDHILSRFAEPSAAPPASRPRPSTQAERTMKSFGSRLRRLPHIR